MVASQVTVISKVNELQQQLQQDQIHFAQKATDEHLLHNILGDIQVLSNENDATQEFSSNLQEQFNGSLDYSQFPFKDYERIGLQLESAWLLLPKNDTKRAEQPRRWKQRLRGWLKKAWQLLTGTSDNFIIWRLNQKIKEAVLATKDTPFPVELPLNRRRLAIVRENVSSQLKSAYQWQELQRQLAQTQSQLTANQQKLDSLLIERQQVQNRLANLSTGQKLANNEGKRVS